MYLEHFGLDVFPYEIVPDLKFIYNSGHYREAMTRLMYAIMRRNGAVLLTGDVGCGKMTLSRALIQSLAQKENQVGLITTPCSSPSSSSGRYSSISASTRRRTPSTTS